MEWRLAPSAGEVLTERHGADLAASAAGDLGKSQPQAEDPGPGDEAIGVAAALPADSLLNAQWHLGNTGGLLDLRVRGVWDPASGVAYTGAGIRVVVIDDGFDYNHPDLAVPYDEGLDYDFLGVDQDPFGGPGESHGTAVTGIIGADNNGTGVVGIAFDSSLVGYRTSSTISDLWLQNIRDAIHGAAVLAQGDVANISQSLANNASSEWGIGFNAIRFDEIETSIGTAVTQGRGGLGMTVVKSAGNSRADNYDVNADDWTNDTRQVVVAAVDQNGFVSSYSSYGAALLVSAFGTPGQVVTTDRSGAPGYSTGDVTFSFSGTSAAAPMVSGIVALIYDADPDLGWRDVQGILAYSARHVGSAVGGATAGSERYAWQFNAADNWNGGGLHFSNDYGFGLVDGLAAVRLAETWLDTAPAQTSANEAINLLDMLNAAVVIPDGSATGQSFTGTAADDDEVERVTLTLTFTTTWTDDLEIYVTSPDGTTSELIDDVGGDSDYNGTWTFETQAFRGERAAGTWTVRIVDDTGGDRLTVSDVVLRTFGRDGVDDRYVFTNEFAAYAGTFGHVTTLEDTNGGIDAINAAAVTSGSQINLNPLAASVVAGVGLTIAAGTRIENAYGGDGNDTLIGNAAANRLLGGRGDDRLDGGRGTDSLHGGDGNDILVRNAGGPDEIMDGGEGSDTGDWSREAADSWTIGLTAGTANIGSTTYARLTSIENVTAGQRDDTVTGTAGANRLDGQGGNDSLVGGDANDTLNGGTGSDTVSGGGGNDLIFVVLGAPEVIIGGAGVDTLDTTAFTGACAVNLGTGATNFAGDSITQMENIVCGIGNDTLTGSSAANAMNGGGGNDSIDGAGGADSLSGGNGNDQLNGAAGADTLNGGGGADTLTAGPAVGVADVFVFTEVVGNDSIIGFASVDDEIRLDRSDFTGLSPGVLGAANFIVKAGPAATAPAGTAQVIYDTTTGGLWFDPDGLAAAAGIRFATLAGIPAIVAADFVIF